MIDIKLGYDDSYCYIDSEYQLFCLKGDEEESLPLQVLNHGVTKVVMGRKHICIQILIHFDNVKKFEFICWGEDHFDSLKVPDFIAQSNQEIELMEAGQYTTCIKFYQSPTLHCWGAIPQQMVPVTVIAPLVVSFGGDDTVCAIIYKNYQNELDSCWGKCTGSMCQIPSYVKLNVSDVSVGYDHVCAMQKEKVNNTMTHKVECWGGNNHGQTSVPELMTKWVESVSAGQYWSCGMLDNWHLTCWGAPFLIPQAVSNMVNFIAAGGRHTCLNKSGDLNCIGNNEFNQLEVPKLYNNMVNKVSTGWDFSCLLTLDFKVACWGFNYLGQVNVPVEVSNSQVEIVSNGLNHSCATYFNMDKDATRAQILCWGGHNVHSELDAFNDMERSATMLSVGDEHSCALLEARGVYMEWLRCWGDNAQGQVDLPGIVQEIRISALAAGGAHTCVTRVGLWVIYCWGSNNMGQAAPPEELRRGRYRVVSLVAGAAHTCVLKTGSKLNSALQRAVVCWGDGYRGEVRGLKIAKVPRMVAAGFNHDCVVGMDGTAECWGDNEYDQCSTDLVISN